MKAGNFTGITGFPNQDTAVWVTVGPIANRSDERLGASDLAIVEFRRRIFDALAELEQDAEAVGTGAKTIPQTVRSYQAVMPGETGQRTYAARYVNAKHALPEDRPAALATGCQVRQ